MSFKRHGEIYPIDGSVDPNTGAPAHRSDEFPAGYSLAGRSPAEPASASPTAAEYASILWRRLSSFLRSAYSLTKHIGSESTLANLFFCPADGVHLKDHYYGGNPTIHASFFIRDPAYLMHSEEPFRNAEGTQPLQIHIV